MPTANQHIDSNAGFWTSTEHGGPTDARPYESTAESVHEDATSAYREAQGRAERESEIHGDDVESLAHGWGGLKPALEYAVATTRNYKVNPLAAREQHYRDYASRPPRITPEPPKPREPHPDLDPRGLREWHLENDVIEATRNAPLEQARKRELESAKELLAQAASELGTTPGQLLTQAAAVDQAMQVNPAHVSEKVARFFGKPVNEAHANDIVAAHVEQQEAANLHNWLYGEGGVIASNALPGLEHQEVRTAVAQVLKHPDFQWTDNEAQNLVNAYSVVAQQVREHVEGEQRKEAAERARHASRSVAGSGAPANYTTDDITGGSIEDDVRRAMYSSRA
jgi:hypothetical protein